jgi:hypothetical protein
MSRLDISYVTSPREEFRQFAKNRVDGLGLTEQEGTVELYRQAMEEGLAYLSDEDEAVSCD